MPEGDPPSPYLFNLFMDSYIKNMNVTVSRGLSTVFVKDVLLLARSLLDMQCLLSRSKTWADEVKMVGATQKSCGLKTTDILFLGEEHIPNKNEDMYLCVSLGPKAVTDARLVKRIQCATNILKRIRTTTSRWRLSVRQRRGFVKTFVRSVCNYILYVQPMPNSILESARTLERQCASYVLDAKVPAKDTERALALACLLPIQARRKRNQAVSKFHQRAISETACWRNLDNWRLISEYDTIKPFITNSDHLPSQDELPKWTTVQLDKMHEHLQASNNMKRRIPTGKKLAPVFTSEVSTLAERKATMW